MKEHLGTGFRHYKPQAAGKQLLVLMESAVKINFGVAELWRDMQIVVQWWHRSLLSCGQFFSLRQLSPMYKQLGSVSKLIFSYHHL